VSKKARACAWARSSRLESQAYDAQVWRVQAQVQQAEAQIASGRAAIRRAEADLAEARRQLGVNERLSREQILATDALEESRARVRVLEAAIGQVDADVMRMEAARMQSLPQVAEAFTRLGFPAPRLSRTSASPPTSGWSSRGPSSSA
jgi:multidrug resistance efflux pump